jgi:hypothetical protein
MARISEREGIRELTCEEITAVAGGQGGPIDLSQVNGDIARIAKGEQMLPGNPAGLVIIEQSAKDLESFHPTVVEGTA